MTPMKMTTSVHAAAMILDCHGDVSALGDRLTCGKMHGLVYIAHESHLRCTGQPLVGNMPAARRIGPVFPALEDVIGSGMRDTAGLRRLESVQAGCAARQRGYILLVCNRYKNWSAEHVMRELRRRGSPWRAARWRNRSLLRKCLMLPSAGAAITDECILENCR